MKGTCRMTLFLIILIFWPSCYSSEIPCYTDHMVNNVAVSKMVYGVPHVYPPSNSVDGDRSDLPHRCYMSGHLPNPWLVVDLGEQTPVSTVVIVARGDAEYYYTTNLRVLVGNDFVEGSFDPTTYNSEQCGGFYQTLERAEMMYIHCNRTLVGRYVCVYMENTHYLQICELEVYSQQVFQHEAWTCVLPQLQRPNSTTNLALNRPVYLSSAPYGEETPALLVDGNDDPQWYTGFSCTHTNPVVNPWFVVDLGRVSMVTGVKLVNRQDCCYEWIRHLTIYVGNNEGPATPFDSSKYEVCAKICHQQTMKGRYYSCHTWPRGRYVALSHYVTYAMYLMLCEVQVYGEIARDVSFPSRESGLRVTPSGQWQLYDNDDTTCVDAAEDLLGDGHQLSLTLQWDPKQMNSEHDNVAVYRCKEDFYVNITHGSDLRYDILKANGSLTESNISGMMVTYNGCPMIGQTETGGLFRSRFQCQCTEKCHLLLRLRPSDIISGGDNRLCTLRLYD